MAVTLSISITQNSQSIPNNTSNVTVKVKAKSTNGSYNYNNPDGSCTINGTKYNFDHDFSPNTTTTVFSKTLNIAHNSDGSKTLSVSASFKTGVSSGTITASASKTLTTIPRKSDLTVANGTLGTAQTLTISEKASAFYHKLTYSCGDASGYILGSASATSSTLSTSWTPPLSLAAQNIKGTSVSIKFTLYTYTSSSGTLIGSNSYTKTFMIPDSVKPTVTIAVSDPTRHLATYGKYIQGKSKVGVVATASGSQGSTIDAYKTSANGASYNTATVETEIIKNSGTLTISTTVTDSRNRTASDSETITVLAYNAPKISDFEIVRCNSDGTLNNSGAYLKAIFSAQVTALENKNSATYSIKYKKTTASSYGSAVTVSNYGTGTKYNAVDGYYIFAADTTASYDVQLSITDAFSTTTKSAVGQTTSVLFSIFNDFKGWAFGKVAELTDYLDINFKARFRKKAEFDSTLDVTGAATFDSTLTVSGGTTLDSTLDVTGAATFDSQSTFNAIINQVSNGITSKFGARNSSHCHIETTASSFYMNKPIAMGGSLGTETYPVANVWIANEGIVMSRNAENNGDIGLVHADSSNYVRIGGTNNSRVYIDTSGQSVMLRDTYFHPEETNTVTNGTSNFRWIRVYSVEADSVSSDERLKNNIIAIKDLPVPFSSNDNALEQLFHLFAPKIYCLNDDEDNKTHIGFVAQDIEAALDEVGMSVDEVDFIMHDYWIDEETGEEKDEFSLAYTEFIALNTHMIQKAYGIIEEQQAEINDLKDRIERLEKLLSATK